MPHLATFRRVDNLAGEHIFNVLCDCLLFGNLVQESQALGVDLGVGVVEPDLAVEALKPEHFVACLMLQQVAQVSLAGY